MKQMAHNRIAKIQESLLLSAYVEDNFEGRKILPDILYFLMACYCP